MKKRISIVLLAFALLLGGMDLASIKTYALSDELRIHYQFKDSETDSTTISAWDEIPVPRKDWEIIERWRIAHLKDSSNFSSTDVVYLDFDQATAMPGGEEWNVFTTDGDRVHLGRDTEEFEDLYLVAEYKEVPKLRVKFDTDGGTPIPGDQEVKIGEKIVKPADPIKDGYVFTHWSTPSKEEYSVCFDEKIQKGLKGFKVLYGDGSKVTGSTNVYFDVPLTLKAIYKAEGKTYQVSFDSKGGDIDPETQNVKAGDYATKPSPDPKKEGYYFAGWQTPKELAWQFDNFEVTRDIKLEAKWKKKLNFHIVAFDTDGGSPMPQWQPVDDGEKAKKPDTDPSKDGYTFKHWALAGETSPYDFNQVVTGDITLKAIYDKTSDAKTYKISFDTDEGSPEPPVQEIIEEGSPVKPSPDPKKAGYIFDYWSYDGEKLPSFEMIHVTEDMTFTAVYKKAEGVRVSFDARGGSPEPDTQTLSIGEKVVKPSQKPVKGGYTFLRWEDAKGEYDFDTPVERDMILYAKYSKDGESHDKSNRTDIDVDDKDYDKAIIKYKDPFFSGYPDRTFKPDDTISRAEMATVFARILGLQNKEIHDENMFTDLTVNGKDHWAKKNIIRVAEYGLIKGYPDGRYDPEGKMKRGEIASIVNQYWKLTGFQPNREDANVEDIQNHWAKKLILALYNHRFVDLYEDNSFYPDAPLKRADVGQILNRITDRKLDSNPYQKYTDVPSTYWAFEELFVSSSRVKDE